MRMMVCGMLSIVIGGCASSNTNDSLTQSGPSTPYGVVNAKNSHGSLWNQDPESLFGNRRARGIGDILTVVVEINDEAEMDNEVDHSRSSQENFGVRAMFGLPEYAANVLPGGATLDPGVDYNRDRSFSGSGSIKREDKITLRLAARVTEMLPNGYMKISGQQVVRVNYEQRILRAEGIVRPEDISRSNTIAHDRIANAQIGYVGKGAIDRETKPRMGSRFLNFINPL